MIHEEWPVGMTHVRGSDMTTEDRRKYVVFSREDFCSATPVSEGNRFNDDSQGKRSDTDGRPEK